MVKELSVVRGNYKVRTHSRTRVLKYVHAQNILVICRVVAHVLGGDVLCIRIGWSNALHCRGRFYVENCVLLGYYE